MCENRAIVNVMVWCFFFVHRVQMSSLIGCFLPDRGGLISFIQPILGRNDVHAPQTPVVSVSGVSVLLHLEGVVFDVIYGRQDDPSALFFYPGQDRLRPEEEENKQYHVLKKISLWTRV